MEIAHWYANHFESRIAGRYITLEHITTLLDGYALNFEISVGGYSELGQPIPYVKIGKGPNIVLGWSQMHGNESTTTKALFDFFKFLAQKDFFQAEISKFLNTYTFCVFPMLNPDGSKRYTRENANNIDLNRDAQALSQKESQCLRNAFETLHPSLCLNLHDQRSIYGFKNGKPATVSFLSPAVNKSRTLTNARKIAMQEIVKMNTVLQQFIPGQVGRYDDSFNEACVGDTFQKAGVPTILFEAGHHEQDYQREKTREYIFYALLSLFDFIGNSENRPDYSSYFDLPENLANYNDFILRNVKLQGENKPLSVAIQFDEVLENDKIRFSPIVNAIGNLRHKFGHREKNGEGREILTNSEDKLTIGENISEIYDKLDYSIIYFKKTRVFI